MVEKVGAGAQRPFHCAAALHRVDFLPLAIAAVYLGLCIFFLLSAPIGSSSEAREAHIVQSITGNGTFFMPSRNGLFPSKPPLFHWLAGMLLHVVGGSPLAIARLVSALSAALLVLFTVLTSRGLGAGLGGAALSGFILVTNYEFIRLSVDCRVDMLFCLLVFLAVRPFLPHKSETSQFVSTGRLNTLFSFAALAVLTKGPLGIILPIIIVYPLVAVQSGALFATRQLLKPVAGWLIFVLLIVPWYVYAGLSSHGGIVDRQVVFENVRRFFGGDFVNAKPFWYYFIEGLRASFPWIPLFFLTIPVFMGRWRSRSCSSRYLLLFFPILIVILFFSAASGKRYSYLAPIFPFLSIYLSEMWMASWNSFTDKRRALLCRAAIAGPSYAVFFAWSIIFVLGLIGLQWPVLPTLASFARGVIDSHAAAIAGALTLASVATWYVHIRAGGSVIGNCLAGWLTVQPCVFTLIFLPLTIRNSFCNFEGMADRINRLALPGESISAVRHVHDEYLDPLLYYLSRPVSILDPARELPCGSLTMTRRAVFETLAERVRRAGKSLDVETILTQIPDSVRGPDERDVVVFRTKC